MLLFHGGNFAQLHACNTYQLKWAVFFCFIIVIIILQYKPYLVPYLQNCFFHLYSTIIARPNITHKFQKFFAIHNYAVQIVPTTYCVKMQSFLFFLSLHQKSSYMKDY